MPDSNDPWPRNRRTDAFERNVAVQLHPHLESDAIVLVACSGGPDSVATLVATSRALTPHRVIAAHFDHRIRPAEETAADAAFVQSLARGLGVPVTLGRADAPLAGDEAGARAARYRWLAGALTEVGATSAITGHTRDDQAETVLLNLARGAGLRGASGMAVASAWPLAVPGGTDLQLLRPLLGTSRIEVERYLDALEVEARLDPTNELTTYARNRVRREVLPALEAVNPEARAQLAAFASRAREADDALEDWARRELETHGETADRCARVDRRALAALPPAVAKRVVVGLGRSVGLELNAAQRDELVAIAARRGARVDLAGGRALTDDRWLVVSCGSGR